MWKQLGYAPLLPFAVAATIALVADRHLAVPPVAWTVLGVGGLVVALWHHRRGDVRTSTIALWVGLGGFAGLHHHDRRHGFAADDIGHQATPERKLVRVRGHFADEPVRRKAGLPDPLIARPRLAFTSVTFEVTEIQVSGEAVPASGLVRLSVEGELPDLRIGDRVEVTGWLAQPSPPLNPGEIDHRDRLRDQRILAEIRAGSPEAVVRLGPRPWSPGVALSEARHWGRRGIDARMSTSDGSIAAALLLGETTAMGGDDWERYVRTGVVHVLAISGQHLVILGWFLWIALRCCGVPRRTAAVTVASVLLSYAFMTGGRPSAMRAAIMYGAYAGAVLLRTRALPANTFALAWLGVLAYNPTDLFTAGFQISFLCVAVLVWGVPRWLPKREPTPLEELIDESRSILERGLRWVSLFVLKAYLVTLILGLATAPLIAYWQNLVSPAGVVIGPPMILLTTIALIAGFLLLMLWPIGIVAWPLAAAVEWSVRTCDNLVRATDRFPAACWYVGAVPVWWVVGFYAIGITMLAHGQWPRRYLAVLGLWTIVGVVAVSIRPTADEMRMTFVAVDHGGCVVIETPDGRVLLYDAGTTAGPDAVKRQVAPFLWSRGIRRIDEVFISHADLDHFNGLPALLDRFAVGQVTLTPSFAEKPTGGVRSALASMEARGVAIRIAQAGDRFDAGDVTLEVRHPPATGPPGIENVRSLVLLVRHRGHRILLTGDLEGVGIDGVVAEPIGPVDVLMAPHHGSPTRADVLADWARPRLAVSSQGRADAGKASAVYAQRGVPYWSTWPDGAITLRSHATGLTAETFATRRREVVQAGSDP